VDIPIPDGKGSERRNEYDAQELAKQILDHDGDVARGLEGSRFADAIAKVIKASATRLFGWATLNTHIFHARAVEWKNTLNTLTLHDTAHGESFADARTAKADDLTHKRLDTLFVALTDEVFDFDNVSNVERSSFFFHVELFDFLDDVHDL